MASDGEHELLASDSEMMAGRPGNDEPSLNQSSFTNNPEQLFHQFVQLLDSKLDQKLASFKRSLDTKDEIHSSQIKKMKKESKAAGSFKFKGNRIQYEFNVGVLDSLEHVTRCLLEGNLTQVNAEIERQKSAINKRNKLIRFADKSPAGWTAVDEYESDELAENSEDEKKLRSAEKRAMEKIKLNKQSSKFSKPNLRKQPSIQQTASTSGFQPQRFQPFLQPFRGVRRPQPTDKCFSCGQPGHWASSPICANKYRNQNRQTAATSN